MGGGFRVGWRAGPLGVVIMADKRFLIIGQGLAGTALAWRLWRRGAAFLIVDRGEPVTCSRIAAGLVTPITGMRLNLNWRFNELRDEARAFYREVEKLTGALLYHELDQVRVFRGAEERELFRRRLAQPEVAAQVTRAAWEGPGDLLDGSLFAAPFGGFEQRGGGFLDAAGYLTASRAFFEAQGCFQEAEARDIGLAADGAPVWREGAFKAVFFCQGWEAARHAWFDWLPFQSARGSIVSARAPALEQERRVVNGGGCWLLRRPDGTLRAGPTYEPRFDPARPHEAGQDKLETLRGRLESLVRTPLAWDLVSTAVRPIVKRARVLLGRHPRREHVGFFNGLGSKGALRAPWAARRLVEHWLDDAPLEAEVDLRGNW